MTNDTFDSSLLWEKICTFSKKAGRLATRPALLLYYVMTDPATPRSAKIVVAAALAYLVLPVDLISHKKHPVTGWLDDIAALGIAVDKVRRHITPEMEKRADEQLDKWFGTQTNDAVPTE